MNTECMLAISKLQETIVATIERCMEKRVGTTGLTRRVNRRRRLARVGRKASVNRVGCANKTQRAFNSDIGATEQIKSADNANFQTSAALVYRKGFGQR